MERVGLVMKGITRTAPRIYQGDCEEKKKKNKKKKPEKVEGTSKVDPATELEYGMQFLGITNAESRRAGREN